MGMPVLQAVLVPGYHTLDLCLHRQLRAGYEAEIAPERLRRMGPVVVTLRPLIPGKILFVKGLLFCEVLK